MLEELRIYYVLLLKNYKLVMCTRETHLSIKK